MLRTRADHAVGPVFFALVGDVLVDDAVDDGVGAAEFFEVFQDFNNRARSLQQIGQQRHNTLDRLQLRTPLHIYQQDILMLSRMLMLQLIQRPGTPRSHIIRVVLDQRP